MSCEWRTKNRSFFSSVNCSNEVRNLQFAFCSTGCSFFYKFLYKIFAERV